MDNIRDIKDPVLERGIAEALEKAGLHVYLDDDVIRADNVGVGSGNGSVNLSVDVFEVNGQRWIKLHDVLVSKTSQGSDEETAQWALVLSTAALSAGVVSVHLRTPGSGIKGYGLVAELWAYAEGLSADHLLEVVTQFIAEVDILDDQTQQIATRVGI